MENYSLSDIKAVTDGIDGWGGNSIITLLLLFALISGGGIFGNRGDYGQFATAASQQEILFGQQFQNLDNKMDRLGNGIADSTFALNNSIHNAQDVVAGAVVSEGRGIQGQLADMNLTTQKNTDALRYDLAQMFYNSDSRTAAGIQELKDMIKDSKIETLQGRVNTLELQSAMCGVVRYPNSMTYDAGRSPFCGCGNGCCM